MKSALQSGTIPQSRLDDMVERILWALFAKGPLTIR
jgi:beta-glucosidase